MSEDNDNISDDEGPSSLLGHSHVDDEVPRTDRAAYLRKTRAGTQDDIKYGKVLGKYGLVRQRWKSFSLGSNIYDSGKECDYGRLRKSRTCDFQTYGFPEPQTQSTNQESESLVSADQVVFTVFVALQIVVLVVLGIVIVRAMGEDEEMTEEDYYGDYQVIDRM